MNTGDIKNTLKNCHIKYTKKKTECWQQKRYKILEIKE